MARTQITSGTGLKFDAVTDTFAATANVLRPISVLAGEGDLEIATVKNADQAGSVYALVMRLAGTAAHDAVDVGSPLKVGGRAITAVPTAVAVGDRVDARFTTQGDLAVVSRTMHGPIFVPGDGYRSVARASIDTVALNNTATSLIGAAGSGIFAYVIGLSFSSSATAVVKLRTVAGSTVLYSGQCIAGVPHVIPCPDNGFIAASNNNEALEIYASAAANVSAHAIYFYSTATL